MNLHRVLMRKNVSEPELKNGTSGQNSIVISGWWGENNMKPYLSAWYPLKQSLEVTKIGGAKAIISKD